MKLLCKLGIHILRNAPVSAKKLFDGLPGVIPGTLYTFSCSCRKREGIKAVPDSGAFQELIERCELDPATAGMVAASERVREFRQGRLDLPDAHKKTIRAGMIIPDKIKANTIYDPDGELGRLTDDFISEIKPETQPD